MTELLLLWIAANQTRGVATQYIESEHLGNPLYCDSGDGLIYDRSVGPWVAMPKYAFEQGLVMCGDLIEARGDDWTVRGRAYDSGDLHTRTFRGGLPIVVDVPEYWATWDSPVPRATVTNWSAVARICIEKGYCD